MLRRLVGTLDFANPTVPWLPRAACATALVSSLSSAAAASGFQCAPDELIPFALRESFNAGRATKILRFDLPIPTRQAPSGVKVLFDGVDEKLGLPKVLEKSYSPISLPSAEGYFDILVKKYPPRAGGGVGAFLCSLNPGEVALMRVKAPRVIHGSEAVAGRWARLGFVAGGTGVAPFLQIIRALLADDADETRMRLLFVNRREEDILARAELDDLAARFPGRFNVAYSLTQPGDAWGGLVGRGSADMARAALSWDETAGAPTTGGGAGAAMVMVCGTDGFVETWSGPLTRVKNADGTKRKVQGPVLGFLRDAGFTATEVYKF